VVQDGGTEVLSCPSLIFAGSEASLLEDGTASTATLSAAYRALRVHAGTAELPVPGDLIPAASTSGRFDVVRAALISAARACVWYWLAHHVTVKTDRVTVRFDGVRTVEFELLPYDGETSDAELELFTWGAASVDPARDDAIHQAVTFAVRDPADLAGAAAPVLRTARSLYELAARGAVAEALATRRGAREAAIAAARSAAEAARDVAAKSIERALALILAAALAVFAHAHDALSASAAVATVVAAASLALAALFVSDRVEIASGVGLLAAFDTDVELYREALSADDLASIKNLAAVVAARKDLRRSRGVARGIYGAVAVLILAAGSIFIATHDTKPNPRPVPQHAGQHTARPQTR
jgi:hypothetical protein